MLIITISGNSHVLGPSFWCFKGWGHEKWEEGKIRAEERDLWKGLGTTENNGG